MGKKDSCNMGWNRKMKEEVIAYNLKKFSLLFQYLAAKSFCTRVSQPQCFWIHEIQLLTTVSEYRQQQVCFPHSAQGYLSS